MVLAVREQHRHVLRLLDSRFVPVRQSRQGTGHVRAKTMNLRRRTSIECLRAGVLYPSVLGRVRSSGSSSANVAWLNTQSNVFVEEEALATSRRDCVFASAIAGGFVGGFAGFIVGGILARSLVLFFSGLVAVPWA